MILDEKLQSQDQSILPTAEQMKEMEEAQAGGDLSLPEADDQAHKQSAQEASNSPSDEGLRGNASELDKTIAVSAELSEQPAPKELTQEERREELRNYVFRIIDGDLTEEEKAELGNEFAAGFGEGFVDELNEAWGYLQAAAQAQRAAMDGAVTGIATLGDQQMTWLMGQLAPEGHPWKKDFRLTDLPIPASLKRYIEGAKERTQEDLAAAGQFFGNTVEETQQIVDALRGSPELGRQAGDILRALGQDKVAQSYFNSGFSQQTTLVNRGQSIEKTREDLKHLIGLVLEHADDEMLSVFEAAREGGPRLAGQVTGMVTWEALKAGVTSAATAGTGTGLAAALGAKKVGSILDKIKDAKKTADAAIPPAARRKLPSKLRAYVQDVEKRTGFSIGDKQVQLLKDALRKRTYSKLPTAQAEANRSAFNKVKNDLIVEWERETKQTWPRYTEDVPCKSADSGFSRYKDDPYDAHHLIENEIDGPATWWNIHPARFPDQHQGGIHGAGSPLRELLKELEDGVK